MSILLDIITITALFHWLQVTYPKLETQKWKEARRPIRSRVVDDKPIQADNVIKFVQMADVHIEPEYDEVYNIST